jgi:small subunit ribosomal protein S4
MARYTGPKNRLARREGIDLGLKTVGSKAHASLSRRLTIPPGQHGQKGKRKVSEYGEQLREKQKVKRLYGLMEKQFRRYFATAKKWKGNTGDKLIEFLERRLDNVVYRLNLAPTRASARQFVSHGHVLVDGKRLGIPSYQVKADEVIAIKPKALEIPAIKKSLEITDMNIPLWLERQGPVGKIARLPVRSDVMEDISEQLIVEFYSR